MLIKTLPTILFLLIWLGPSIIYGAAAHKHTHGKERTEDGAFSPRDQSHFDEEGWLVVQELENCEFFS